MSLWPSSVVSRRCPRPSRFLPGRQLSPLSEIFPSTTPPAHTSRLFLLSKCNHRSISSTTGSMHSSEDLTQIQPASDKDHSGPVRDRPPTRLYSHPTATDHYPRNTQANNCCGDGGHRRFLLSHDNRRPHTTEDDRRRHVMFRKFAFAIEHSRFNV